MTNWAGGVTRHQVRSTVNFGVHALCRLCLSRINCKRSSHSPLDPLTNEMSADVHPVCCPWVFWTANSTHTDAQAERWTAVIYGGAMSFLIQDLTPGTRCRTRARGSLLKRMGLLAGDSFRNNDQPQTKSTAPGTG